MQCMPHYPCSPAESVDSDRLLYPCSMQRPRGQRGPCTDRWSLQSVCTASAPSWTYHRCTELYTDSASPPVSYTRHTLRTLSTWVRLSEMNVRTLLDFYAQQHCNALRVLVIVLQLIAVAYRLPVASIPKIWRQNRAQFLHPFLAEVYPTFGLNLPLCFGFRFSCRCHNTPVTCVG